MRKSAFLYIISICAHLSTFAQENYLFPDFLPGVVFYKQEEALQCKMNYNLLKGRIFVLIDNKIKDIPRLGETEYVVIGKARFVLLESGEFGEILLDGEDAQLAVRHFSVVKKESANAKAVSRGKLDKLIGDGQPVPEGISIKCDSIFHLVKTKKNTRMIHLAENKSDAADLRGFMKVYPNLKNQIQDYVNERNPDFSKYDDVKSLFDYCEKR